ncbi:MAG: hypothetical protein RL110_1234 [Bacteroidota bacterium]
MTVFSVKGFSQSAILIDTLRPQNNFLSSINGLDSILQSSRSVFPNIRLIDGIFVDPMSLYTPFGSFFQKDPLADHHPVFSGLPFVGFNYAFGTQGAQHLNLKYCQSFKRGLFIGLSYDVNSLKGYVRNSQWINRKAEISLSKIGRRFRSQALCNYYTDSRQFSGGILNDSLLSFVGLGLVPVVKDSCSALVKQQHLQWKNELNFSKDSSRFIGLYHRSSLDNFDRFYAERDTLLGFYGAVNYYSTLTQDRTELSTLKNALGFGVRWNHWDMELMSNADFWRYRMRGVQHDTLELGFSWAFQYRKNRTNAFISFAKNFIGGFQASSLKGHFLQTFNRDQALNLKVAIGLDAPDVMQRFYLGNTFLWTMVQPVLQKTAMVQALFKGKVLGFDYQLGVNGLISRDVYQFNGMAWDHQSSLSNQQVLHLEVKLGRTWKGWTIEPHLTTLWQKVAILPKMGLGTGIVYQGYIGSTKNLYFFTKLKYMYYMDYKTLGFIPQLSLFDVVNFSNTGFNYHGLNALIGFKVKTFQFYLAGENLGSFFMENQQRLFVGLPVPSWQLKLGITWFFWN